MIRQRDSEMAQHKRILDWEKQTSLPGISALHGRKRKNKTLKYLLNLIQNLNKVEIW